MKKETKATSIIEAMVVMLIVVTSTVGIYQVYINSQKLQISTGNRITAIQIAREWIEIMHNIRDTNTMLFSADLSNCWNVLNYNGTCIWNITTTNDIGNNISYITYKDTDNKWKLIEKTTWSYTNATYRNDFLIKKDTLWFFTQSGWTVFLPVYTRELLINYIEDTNWDSLTDSNDEKMKITSIVRWADSSKTWFYEIKFDTILSNWKNGN